MIRPQYHFRKVGEHTYIWDVRKLLALADPESVFQHPLSQIKEIDEPYWFGDSSDQATCRAVMAHAAQAEAADLSYAILLCADGRIMDGMHRVMKAVAQGRDAIPARKLSKTPPPDFLDKHPDELRYD